MVDSCETRMCERQPHRDDGSGWATEGKAQVHPGMPNRWRERKEEETNRRREWRDLAGEARRRELQRMSKDGEGGGGKDE